MCAIILTDQKGEVKMKAFKYRIYPTGNQTKKLQLTLDLNREIYNAALEERREAWRMSQVNVTYAMQSAQLPDIKEDRPEFKEVYSQILQDTLKRVDKAFKAFFKRCKQGQTPGFPRFQGYDRYDSFTYPQIEKLKGTPTITIQDGKISLPKIGHVRIKKHRDLEGKAKTAAVKREGDRWYVVITCEVEQRVKLPYTDLPIGIDMGLKHFMTDSNGDTVDNPRFFRQAHGDLKKAQQNLARKKKRSHRRKKAVTSVAKAHKKVRNQRQDFHHKESRILVDLFETIVFEDLSLHHMVKRPKAKQDENGAYLPNGAAAKGGLNKSILDAGWANFISMVKHKAEWAGVTVIEVDPRNTSQECSGCHIKGPHKDLSVRTHTCVFCGMVLDRDHNAAINILSRGLGLSPRETASSGYVPLG
jgi:putative transposase